jgi:Tfp pilus assembly protein PilO
MHHGAASEGNTVKTPVMTDAHKPVPSALDRVGGPSTALTVGGIALILAAGAVFYWLSVRPIANLQGRLDQQQRQLLDRRTQARKLNAKAQQGRTALETARQSLHNSPVQLAPASSTNREIRVLSDLAAKAGLKTEEVLPAEPSYSAYYGCVPIHLTGHGSYAAWTQFVHLLAGEHPDVSIDTFDLTGTPEDESATMQFAVDLTWFTSPQAVAAK